MTRTMGQDIKPGYFATFECFSLSPLTVCVGIAACWCVRYVIPAFRRIHSFLRHPLGAAYLKDPWQQSSEGKGEKCERKQPDK